MYKQQHINYTGGFLTIIYLDLDKDNTFSNYYFEDN